MKTTEGRLYAANCEPLIVICTNTRYADNSMTGKVYFSGNPSYPIDYFLESWNLGVFEVLQEDITVVKDKVYTNTLTEPIGSIQPTFKAVVQYNKGYTSTLQRIATLFKYELVKHLKP